MKNKKTNKTFLVKINHFVTIKINSSSESGALSEAQKICKQAFSKLKISIAPSSIIKVKELKNVTKGTNMGRGLEPQGRGKITINGINQIKLSQLKINKKNDKSK